MSLINQMLQDLEKRRASGTERATLPDQVRVLPREESRSMPWWLIGIAMAVALIGLCAWQFNRLLTPTMVQPVAQAPGQAESTTASDSPSHPVLDLQKTPAAVPAPQLPAPAVAEDPASHLALDSQKAPVPTPTPPAAPVERAKRAADVPAPRKSAAATINDASKRNGRLPSPLPTAALLGADTAVTARSEPVAAKAEPSRQQPPPAAPPAVRTHAPAGPVESLKPSVTALKTVEVLPEPKVQPALTNPQIDKQPKSLTPQQLAENDYREAANYMNQGRMSEAQEGFRRALQNNPAHVSARQGLFGLLVDARKKSEAEQLLQEGLALNSTQTGFAMALSSLQYERGDVAAAIDTMQKSAPAAQANPDFLARLAGLLQRQSRHKEAIDSYQAALRLAPGSGVWWMGLGISLQASNRNNEAQDAFRRARNSNSLTPELQAFVDQRMKQLQ